MRIGFLASDKPREQLLADAFLRGAARHGHTTAVHALTGEAFVGPYDVACMVGVKSRELFQAHQRAGIPVIYLDKGYSRQKRDDGVAGWIYWRVSVNSHHPTRRLAEQNLPADRWERLQLPLLGYRPRGAKAPIIIAGSSAKYHEFYGMKDPTAYARGIVRELVDLTDRPLVYRPKPSWRDAVPITKTRFSGSDEDLGKLLHTAYALVTHGSNACFEAVLAGVPCVILGDAVAKPISSTDLAEINGLRHAGPRERRRWAQNLAWWQWTNKEFASGDAWDFIGGELHA